MRKNMKPKVNKINRKKNMKTTVRKINRGKKKINKRKKKINKNKPNMKPNLHQNNTRNVIYSIKVIIFDIYLIFLYINKEQCNNKYCKIVSITNIFN